MKKSEILKASAQRVFERLPPFDEGSGDVNVVIETPQGSRNKYKYDENYGIFKLSGIVPAGAVFPFDFGYVPSTIGEDGDPLDILVLYLTSRFFRDALYHPGYWALSKRIKPKETAKQLKTTVL